MPFRRLLTRARCLLLAALAGALVLACSPPDPGGPGLDGGGGFGSSDGTGSADAGCEAGEDAGCL
jgi:hypothetical protein